MVAMAILGRLSNAVRGRAAVARQAHNLEVVGSNPTPATKFWGFNGRSPKRIRYAPATVVGNKGSTAMKGEVIYFSGDSQVRVRVPPVAPKSKAVVYQVLRHGL